MLLRQSEALELGYFSAILNLILVGLMRGVVYVVEHYFFCTTTRTVVRKLFAVVEVVSCRGWSPSRSWSSSLITTTSLSSRGVCCTVITLRGRTTSATGTSFVQVTNFGAIRHSFYLDFWFVDVVGLATIFILVTKIEEKTTIRYIKKYMLSTSLSDRQNKAWIEISFVFDHIKVVQRLCIVISTSVPVSSHETKAQLSIRVYSMPVRPVPIRPKSTAADDF